MAEISHNSRRVAKNTLLLYLRMLLMMVIGLFTSRVILRTLGVDDFGTYTAVYEMIMLFTVVSNSVSNAISRFMAFEIGRGDMKRQQQVFSSALVIQTIMAVLLTILVVTVGMWYLRTRMVIPEGRYEAAVWVMICSAGLMMVQLYSIPFNATIVANEDMKAFAWISILEACLKLAVALLLYLSPIDKLVAYAFLMLAVGIAVRSTYAVYCRKHFEQTRGSAGFDREIMRQMLSFSGWSFLGSGVNVLNTKGVSLLMNSNFGVGINAARGIASQVENIVKQFVSNFLTALNPQITKSWASGSHDYCYQIVGKGCKFSYLLMLLFAVPIVFEAEMLMQLWLGEVPAYAVAFTRLTVICLMFDMMANSLSQFVLATGKLAAFYVCTSAVMILVLAISWLAYANGADPRTSYWVYIAVYAVADAMKLYFAHRCGGFPIAQFLKESVLPSAAVTLASCALCAVLWYLMPMGWARLFAVCTTGVASVAGFSYLMALTPGEREFIKDNIKKRF